MHRILRQYSGGARGGRGGAPIGARDVARAFASENNQLRAHATLMNQTSWQSLVALADVRPMMAIFRSLAAVDGAATEQSVLATATALTRTAKDSPILLRSLLEEVRVRAQGEVHAELATHCNSVAEAILGDKVPQTSKILGTLLGAYEIVDPAKGAAFYMAGEFRQVGGSVIPCMVKSQAPLAIVEDAYEAVPRKTARVRANMAWAYLRYGEVDKALEVQAQVRDAPPSVEKFLVSAFVGDAPLEVGLAALEDAGVAPHHAAMTRLVQGAWTANQSVDLQLELLDKFLALSRGAQEQAFKQVTYAVTANVVSASGGAGASALENIKRLINVYSQYPSNQIFLNILLTHVAKHCKEELIMPVLKAYGADIGSPVTYRVRLNSLKDINPPNKEEYVRQLWSARTQLQEEVDAYDWLALSKADRALAREIYAATADRDESARTRRALGLRS